MMEARPHPTRTVATTVGAVMLGGLLWLSCQPGELPCDSTPEWGALCSRGGAGGTGGTGTGGTGGGAPVLMATTAVPDCADFRTLGEMDRFFSSRCGIGDLCHNARSPWTPMPTTGVWDTFTKEATSVAKVSCGGGKLTNRATWTDSVVWTKTQTPVMPCPPGSTGTSTGLSMPPQKDYMPITLPLSTAELKCLEGFLKVIAGAQ
jgi:hypothetical protein